MSKIKNFKDFINEASLRGNIGIPGEEDPGRDSWLDKITDRSNTAAREFATQNREDIQNFGSLIQQSKRLQRGHEEELSQLTVDAFREVYGYLLEEIDLEFKIITGNEANAMMQETPTESDDDETELDELEDKEIIDQIHKRKILRTIQQGKGLSSKAILNLSIFKEGLVDILGQESAADYLRVLNKISNVMQFFDWDMSIEMQKQMWQARQGAAGSCDIQFGEKVEDKEDVAQKVLDDLANGEDITDNSDAEDLVSGLNIKLIALGADLSVLIHEGIKAVYKLITQAALEALYGGTADKVLMNTDTLFDELEEIKYGRQMQDVFFKIVANNPDVDQRIQQMLRNEYSDVEITAFQERLNYLFFAEISQLGTEKASEMLEVVNAILSESPDAVQMCEPLIKRALSNVSQGAEYEAFKKKPTQSMEMPSMEAPSREETSMSKQEIQSALDAALDARNYQEAARLGKMLGESVKLSRHYSRLA
jgi:hypothetical protein